MTLIRIAAIASFAALLGGAAYAGDDTKNPMDMTDDQIPAEVTPPVVSSETTILAPSASEEAMPASTLAPDNAPGTITTRLITNGPVPDTAENRARFGGPMSRAGKRTAPTGN